MTTEKPQAPAQDPSKPVQGHKKPQQASEGPKKAPFSEITGGCVCGQIRYTIQFPAGAEWPPKNNGTCQCTACRKFTGSLVQQSLCLPTAHVTPSFSSQASFKTYQSSEKAERGFCSTCGSSLTFQYLATREEIEVHIGTIDEDWLVGKKHPNKKFNDSEYGTLYAKAPNKKGKGVGNALAKTNRHIWFCNAIPGVTGKVEGTKYWTEPDEGKGFDGNLKQFRKVLRCEKIGKDDDNEESATGEEYLNEKDYMEKQ